VSHDEPIDDPLPPLDPDAGLIRQAWDLGDHIIIQVVTTGEALDQHARLAERGSAPGPTYSPDKPDEMHVAADGRPIAVHYSATARQQLDANS
jgi:hypothetical protein